MQLTEPSREARTKVKEAAKQLEIKESGDDKRGAAGLPGHMRIRVKKGVFLIDQAGIDAFKEKAREKAALRRRELPPIDYQYIRPPKQDIFLSPDCQRGLAMPSSLDRPCRGDIPFTVAELVAANRARGRVQTIEDMDERCRRGELFDSARRRTHAVFGLDLDTPVALQKHLPEALEHVIESYPLGHLDDVSAMLRCDADEIDAEMKGLAGVQPTLDEAW